MIILTIDPAALVEAILSVHTFVIDFPKLSQNVQFLKHLLITVKSQNFGSCTMRK